jgi:hypothetical protein
MPIVANVQETTTTAATVHTNSERKNAAIMQGMSIKLPQDLVKLVETDFMNSGMPRSHLVHQPKEHFSLDDHIELFTSQLQYGAKKTCPKRGKFKCKYSGCEWNVAHSWFGGKNIML